jgi:hypothetical protein
MSKTPTPRLVEPLLTRHVFLDTDLNMTVFELLGFEVADTRSAR